MTMIRKLIVFAVGLLSTLAIGYAGATCTTAQQPPSGQASNFDINAHLEILDATATVIDGATPPDSMESANRALKAAAMVLKFGPQRQYDLKNSNVYPSSQEFGNWFYGAGAQRLGFSENEALRAAAIVQQYQDFTNAGHANYQDISQLALGIIEAIEAPVAGTGDNPDDPALISGGHSYAADIYENDPNRSSTSNSCNSSSASTGTTNSSLGWGGSSFTSGFTFIGLSGCIGNCSLQGIVLVEDIDPPDEQVNDN